MKNILKWILIGLVVGITLHTLTGCVSSGTGLIPHNQTIYGGEITVYDGHGHKTVIQDKGNVK